MRRLLSLLLAGSGLFGQVIEGTVQDSVTGAPLAGVTVTIEAVGKTVYRATTDPRGAFRIEGVGQGAYSANFSQPGYQGPDRDRAARRPFRVVGGSDPIRLQVQMTPLGKISGRVLDADGHPVPGAGIQQRAVESLAGETKTTGEHGDFTFDRISPGRHILIARPPRDLKPPAAIGGQARGWVRTYYPDVTDRQAAAQIVIRPGATLAGYDIRLNTALLHRLRGVVLGPKGDPVPGIRVKAETTDDYPPEENVATSAEDGSYEFPALRDQEWRLTAETDGGAARLRASAIVLLAQANLDRQVLRLSPPFILRGSVSFEAPGVSQAAKPKGLVYLEPYGGGSGLAQGAADSDGDLKIENVFPGTYKIRSIPPGPPFYLASVTLGDRDIFGQWVELSGGSPPVRVTYQSDGGRVRGAVEDCRGATVILLPREVALRDWQLLRSARCDAGDRYEILHIRPGLYYAWALDQMGMVQNFVANLGQSLINRAVTVEVHPGATVSLDLRVTERNSR